VKKILFFDTETTGLDPNRNGMIQLAMLIDIDGELVDEINFEIQPFCDDELDLIPKISFDLAKTRSLNGENDGLLPITAISVPMLMRFEEPKIAIQKINSFLQKHISKFNKNDKAYIGGYNVAFDIAFLSKFYEKSGDKYLGSYINWKQIDVRSILYFLDYEELIKPFENYKLSTICDYYGIEIEAHNPLSDIKATREIFYILIGGRYEKIADNQASGESPE
jgi:DNA polymerase-3 subunit epsilon